MKISSMILFGGLLILGFYYHVLNVSAVLR